MDDLPQPPAMIPLSLRAMICLRNAGVTTTARLCALTAEELARIPQVARTTVQDIREALLERGLALRGDEESFLPLWRRLDRALSDLEADGTLSTREGGRGAVLSWLSRSVLGARGDEK